MLQLCRLLSEEQNTVVDGQKHTSHKIINGPFYVVKNLAVWNSLIADKVDVCDKLSDSSST